MDELQETVETLIDLDEPEAILPTLRLAAERQKGKRWQALAHVLGEAEIKLDQLLNAKPEIGREVSRVKAELHAQLVRPDYEFWRQERARVLALNEIHPEIGNYLAAIDTILELEDPAGPDFTKPEPEPAGADAEAKSE